LTLIPGRVDGRTLDGMTTNLVKTSSVPVVPVLVAAAAVQATSGLASIVLPLTGLLAILLTAGAARYVTRDLRGASVARTGLAVGAVSAVAGLIIGGFGFVAVILAGITVAAGVAGAVVGRDIVRNNES
jgi:hypothetical protein